LLARRAAPFRHGQVATAEALAGASADEGLRVFWPALEALAAAIAKAEAGQATHPADGGQARLASQRAAESRADQGPPRDRSRCSLLPLPALC
jgi:hypothetical protein